VTESVRIAVTPGEPAGLGPDLILELLQTASDDERVVVGDAGVLAERAALLGRPFFPYGLDPEQDPQPQQAGEVAVTGPNVTAPVTPGMLELANAAYVVSALEAAIDGCLDATFAALVTGPIHKGVINDAGIAFTGHTERLGTRSGTDPVMMLGADTLRVALATTHLPLRAVADALTRERLRATIKPLAHDLAEHFGVAAPRIGVLGLNPHAGEGGHMGTEERDIIAPALAELAREGYALEGPLAADTAFLPARLDGLDAIVAMYHDQGLPVLKRYGFGRAVNVTLGLPFVRTSVDHGTALDLAGTGRGDAASLATAYRLASELVRRE
jgi:4-hydroxythreonine-4-phosphate dehydrogenase